MDRWKERKRTDLQTSVVKDNSRPERLSECRVKVRPGSPPTMKSNDAEHPAYMYPEASKHAFTLIDTMVRISPTW